MPSVTIIPKGLCVKTCIYAEGEFMHAIVTVVRGGQPHIFKASVDVNSIRRYLASSRGAEVSGIFSSISHAVHSIGRSKLLKGISKAIKSVPVLGPVAAAAVSLETMPFSVGVQLAKGGRIDKVALGSLRTAVGNAKTIAPYAQAVVSFVPGVGQGLSGALGASLALASGHSISDAMVEAVKGAMPGGPLAVAAFNVAHSLAKGDSIDRIALNALPISENAKRAVVQGIALTKDLAAGKRVDASLIDAATKNLPPSITKALQVGTALGHAISVQAQHRKPGSSPVMVPNVSDHTIAAYAIAKNAITAIEDASNLHARVTQIANTGTAAQRALAHANINKIQALLKQKQAAQTAIGRMADAAKCGYHPGQCAYATRPGGK